MQTMMQLGISTFTFCTVLLIESRECIESIEFSVKHANTIVLTSIVISAINLSRAIRLHLEV